MVRIELEWADLEDGWHNAIKGNRAGHAHAADKCGKKEVERTPNLERERRIFGYYRPVHYWENDKDDEHADPVIVFIVVKAVDLGTSLLLFCFGFFCFGHYSVEFIKDILNPALSVIIEEKRDTRPKQGKPHPKRYGLAVPIM